MRMQFAVTTAEKQHEAEMNIPGQKEDIGYPDIIISEVEVTDDGRERGCDHSVLESTQQTSDAERGYDGPETKATSSASRRRLILGPVKRDLARIWFRLFGIC